MNEYDKLEVLAAEIAEAAEKVGLYSRAMADEAMPNRKDLQTLRDTAQVKLNAYIHEHARMLDQMRQDYPL